MLNLLPLCRRTHDALDNGPESWYNAWAEMIAPYYFKRIAKAYPEEYLGTEERIKEVLGD